MATDTNCFACVNGEMVNRVTTRAELPSDWTPNRENTVLWHKTRRCLVMPNRRHPDTWLVGYRESENSDFMSWQDDYTSFGEAFTTARNYIAGGVNGQPTSGGQDELPTGWAYFGYDYEHQSGRCRVKADRDHEGLWQVGYAPRTTSTPWSGWTATPRWITP